MRISNKKIKIAWYGKHFGEEPPLVGSNDQGAGTIFFSGCNLHCVFCQNFQISQEDMGKEYNIEEVANIMLGLQAQGAVNIDLVTPTIWWRLLKEAIIIAKNKGLKIPIAWNSNGYEMANITEKMRELVDIYLPDFKYGDDDIAKKYSGIPKYSEVALRAIKNMISAVGLLKVEDGIAKSGVIIRHMILPNNLENTFLALEKIASINKNVHLSLMSQYCPVYNANNFSELNRPINKEELEKAEAKRFELGLDNGWTQELESGEIFLPDFTKTNPF